MLTGVCRKTALQYVDRRMQEDCLAVCWQAYAGRLPCNMLTGVCRKTALQYVDRLIHFMDTCLFDGLLCHHPPSALVPVPKVCKYGTFWLPAPTRVYLLMDFCATIPPPPWYLCLKCASTSLSDYQHQLVCIFCRLDGKHVVFGEVTDGLDVVRKIESYGSRSGTPSKKIVIANCGQLS